MQVVKAFVKSHPHMWWGLFLPAYLAAFFIIEHFITGNYWATQLPADALIPFCPYFIFFYMSWSPLLVALGLYLIVRDAEGFRRYIWMLALSFFSATLFCVLVPNGQDLRPAEMPQQNIFTWAVQLTYDLDTNTNVFPSVHVLGVVAAVAAVWKTPGLHRGFWRPAAALYGVVIIASTLLVKQHALLDVLAAIPWGLLSYGIVYGVIGRVRDQRMAGAAQKGKMER